MWYFSCTCGSRVFFEDLGYPWPIHTCKARELRDTLEFIQEIERLTTDEIYRRITKHEKDFNVEIPDDILEIIEHALGKRKYPFQVIPSVPEGAEETSLDGMVMNVDKEINLYKRLGYEPNSIFGKAFMKGLADNAYGEITIRENPDKKNRSREYKVLAEQSYLRRHRMQKGDFLIGVIRPVKHAQGTVWVLIEHKVF